MFIFKSNQRRANPYAAYESEDGTRYPRIPAELLEEIPDPQPPEDYSDETYYRTEQDEAPYVVYTRKSDEQLEELRKSKVKAQIAAVEAGQARAVREAALGDTTHLVAVNAKIEELRAML